MASILVKVAGAGSSYSPPGFGGPCIYIRINNTSIVVDPGSSCFSRLTSQGLEPCSVDLFYLSHRHIDHWSDLPQFAVARIANGCNSIRLWIPWRDEADPTGLLQTLPSRINIEIATPKELTVGSAKLKPIRVEHTTPTYGLQLIKDNKLLFYTSDTKYTRDLVEAAKGSKLLIAEATLPTHLKQLAREMGHMTVEDTIRLAKEASPEILIVNHLTPESLAEITHLEPDTHIPIIIGEGFSIKIKPQNTRPQTPGAPQ